MLSFIGDLWSFLNFGFCIYRFLKVLKLYYTLFLLGFFWFVMLKSLVFFGFCKLQIKNTYNSVFLISYKCFLILFQSLGLLPIKIVCFNNKKDFYLIIRGIYYLLSKDLWVTFFDTGFLPFKKGFFEVNLYCFGGPYLPSQQTWFLLRSKISGGLYLVGNWFFE